MSGVREVIVASSPPHPRDFLAVNPVFFLLCLTIAHNSHLGVLVLPAANPALFLGLGINRSKGDKVVQDGCWKTQQACFPGLDNPASYHASLPVTARVHGSVHLRHKYSWLYSPQIRVNAHGFL